MLAVLVGLLGVVHVIQWAVTRGHAPAGTLPPLSQALRGVAGGRDPWARVLLVTALVALSFAAASPLLPTLADLLGRALPG